MTVLPTIKKTSLLVSLLLLAGCAAMQTAIEHRDLETSTKQSQTIFLDPVNPSLRTVYIVMKNSSDEAININAPLKQALQAKGYRVVSNPDNAHYLLQANVLKVGKMSQAASRAALGGGYGAALAGIGTGVAAGALVGTDSAMLGGGLAGGLVSFAADSMVKNVNYTMITDVQISERTRDGVKVREQFDTSLQNGTASRTTQIMTRDSRYQRYRNRVVSTANKVNLKFQDARAVLEEKLVKTLAGIF
ncbi:MAG: complement resistance protein TraT [Legionella sp.]|nr:complement resistance protein TraT [Legionella sp.]